MRFNCGPTLMEKIEELEKWHDWFAWCPVRVGRKDCRWLETVQRKANVSSNWAAFDWGWEYKIKEQS